MTESIKFGPEWLRNSVANVVSPSSQQQHQPQSHHNLHQQHPQSPSDSIISRPVLSDHRYGREEMLSLCDKSARLPDALPRFRRLFVADWQMPLALQPITDDEQIGSRGLGGNGAPAWGGTHIRPLMPAMGGRGSGIIRGGAIERGRGRGRGIYGSSYTRSTSLYDEEGRRWLDRNGTESTAEWSAGSSVSPRKEGFSRNALESWRKGTREENEEGWRSNSNGTNSTGPPAREKWARSTSWRDGNPADNNGLANEMDRSNGTIQASQAISSSPTGNGVNPLNAPNSIKMPIGYKKSWDEENSNLPEWATESFDYGGTFDASGAFHDSERGGGGGVKQNDLKMRKKEELPEVHHEVLENSSPSKFMNFLNDQAPQEKLKPEVSTNGPSQQQQKSAPIAQMDKMVENFVAHLIMDDDKPSSSSVPAPLIEWFYRDPQGDTQGAFSSTDMSEWYKAGYFQESLMVRRSIDNTFTPLGHLVKIFGASRPFITATLDGGPPIPQIPEVIDPYRMQRMMQTQQPPPPVVQPVVVPPPSQQPIQQPDNWSLMTAEQRMFFMQLAAHQQQQQQQQRPLPVVDPYVLKAPQAPPPTGNPQLDLRRMEYFQSSPPSQQIQQQSQPQLPLPQQQKAPEPDPIQQLIMQLQMQQKTGGIDAAQQWMKPTQPPPPIQQQQQVSAMMPIDMQMIRQEPPPQQQQQQQSSSSTHWSGTPMTIWDLGKEQQQQHHHHHHQQSRDEIHQNGIDDQQMHQMQKVESKKKKKEVKDQQQQLQQIVKEQPPKVEKKLPLKEPEKKKKDEKQKKEERTTQPAAPAPWVGQMSNVNQGTSLTKIQKTEAQRRQIEMTAQKERDVHQKQLEMLSRQENRDVKWNLQMANQVKTLDEIQAEEQTAAEREERASKKKEVVTTIVGDIWNTGAHSMAWQQPKAWSGAQSGQSNSGFWEDPIKSAPIVKQSPQMLSKSQTMATISTTKRQVQPNQPQQQQKKIIERVENNNNNNNIGKKRKEEKKKDDVNSEFTIWCNQTLHAMNGNVDIPTFVSFLQDLESPFEVKDYIKMYLGETKECTEFAKQFLEHRSKHRAQQRQMNAHIDDMCSPAPAINPQANSSGDFQEVKGKNKKVKVKKFMKAVDNRILGFTATSAEGRINVGDRDYGDS